MQNVQGTCLQAERGHRLDPGEQLLLGTRLHSRVGALVTGSHRS